MASHTATTMLTLAVIPCPIVSLLAEVVISRYKLVSYSLKATQHYFSYYHSMWRKPTYDKINTVQCFPQH